MASASINLLSLALLFCIQSLSAHAASTAARNPRQLAHVALNVSATRAREASTYVSRVSSGGNGGKSPRSHGPSAFQDCAGMMAHSADRLQRSVEEMGNLGVARSPGYGLRLSNLQTWVSSALTDQDMCLYSLQSIAGGSGLKESVKNKVVSARKVTSNALSFVNRMS